MTDDMIKLGKRAVACKGWRWMPGMLAVEWAAPGMGLTGGRPVRVDERWHGVNVWLPDLTDPATLGCLLALVRKVRKCPAGSVYPHHVTVSPDPDFDVWSWYDSEQPRLIVMDGLTEAEAMVAALEGAP